MKTEQKANYRRTVKVWLFNDPVRRVSCSTCYPSHFLYSRKRKDVSQGFDGYDREYTCIYLCPAFLYIFPACPVLKW